MPFLLNPFRRRRLARASHSSLAARFAALLLASALPLSSQNPGGSTLSTTPASPAAATTAAAVQLPPSLDLTAMNPKADPCQDFYKYACGNYAALHPIPADESSMGVFTTLYNVTSARLQQILTEYAAPSPDRTPNEQKIGDDYAACMDVKLIGAKGLAPAEELLREIDRVSKPGLPYLAGELQRFGVNAFFGYGSEPDFKDATRVIAVIDQGGLGLPDRSYYLNTGARDQKIRQQYVDTVANLLALAGEPAGRARSDAEAVLAFETKLAQASMDRTARRDPNAVYHLESLSQFEATLHGVPFAPFFTAIHSPEIQSLNVASPAFFPALVSAIIDTPIETLRAYLRFHLLHAYASVLPQEVDQQNFRFYGTVLSGAQEQQPRWKRCSATVNRQLGEALGQIYVQKYFGPQQKAETLQMVHDIEAAMDRNIDALPWMSAPTKLKAKAKLQAVTDKIGYPDKWRDYSTLSISPTEAFGNQQRADAFENDRQLNEIGHPTDKLEWEMTPPTINAYYNPLQNNINFPAGILQSPFYNPDAGLAENYGHVGQVVGHELTHGFDDQGSQFDANGNLNNWWTAADTAAFKSRTSCLAKQYSGYVAVDDLHLNGNLTLGENTADNGGLLLAYMAYLQRAKDEHKDIDAKRDGFTGPQRFFLAFAQNWCSNIRPEQLRQRVVTDPHSPAFIRVNGPVVNIPAFSEAFGCKAGTPMNPDTNCRVW